MKQRLDFEHVFPEAWKGILALPYSSGKASLTPIQKQLIKIRASQINACAFCLDLHVKEAVRIGETARRLALINAWREADLFAEEERIIFAITEEMTLIHTQGVSDATYAEAQKYFDEETIAAIIMTAAIINLWNRIAVTTRLPIPK